MLERRADGSDAFENRGIGHHRDIVFGKIDSGFEQGNQFDQFLLDRLQAPRERSLQLLRRDLGLIQSLRVDQIAHRLGLREIDAAVEKGAHGELAGLGQARAGGHAQFDDVPQDDRRSVGGNLDDVVGGVGMRLGEIGDDDFVDAVALVQTRREPHPSRDLCGQGGDSDSVDV